MVRLSADRRSWPVGNGAVYAVASLEEAQAYHDHPVLGSRLSDATEAVLRHPEKTLHAIFGTPDDVKFVSSMTLFDAVAPDGIFHHALEIFNRGKRDPLTLALLKRD